MPAAPSPDHERMKPAEDLTLGQIEVGREASFSRTFTAADVDAFAQLSGDFNPLHVDPDFGQRSQFGRCVVHGMLVASLLSRLVGMHLPGKRCLYLSQTLDFAQPVFVGDELVVSGTVLQKQEAMRILTLATQIRNASGATVLRGKAHVKVFE